MRGAVQVLKFSFILLAAIFTLAASACNRNTAVEAAREDQRATPSATPAEQDFMIKAAQGDVAEIDMARIAMEKSQNSDVKDFANMIQKDHTAALENLTDLMKDKGMPQPNILSPEVKADIEKMTALSGAELDREFVNAMVADHQKAIEMFRDRANIVQSPDVKKYAEDQLPKLEMHLEKAQKLQSELFGGGKP
jgi:putative membrane protein